MLIYANPTISQLPLGTPEGLRINRSGSQEILIASGKALIRQTLTSRLVATVTNFFTKNLNAAWQQGSTLGGRAGALTPNTIYHVYLLINASGSVDAYFDTSPTADSRPSGWSARMIGSFLTDASSLIVNFDQQGDRFEYYGTLGAADTSNLSTSNINVITLPTPSIASGLGTIVTYRATGTANIFLGSEADTNPGAWCTAMPTLSLQHYWRINGNRMRLYTDQANTTIALRIRGFIHPRGANG